MEEPIQLRPADEWHEEIGPVLWYRVEGEEIVGEPPYSGTPLDDEWPQTTDGDDYCNAWIPLPKVCL